MFGSFAVIATGFINQAGLIEHLEAFEDRFFVPVAAIHTERDVQAVHPARSATCPFVTLRPRCPFEQQRFDRIREDFGLAGTPILPREEVVPAEPTGCCAVFFRFAWLDERHVTNRNDMRPRRVMTTAIGKGIELFNVVEAEPGLLFHP